MKQVSKYDNYNNSSSKNYKVHKKRYSIDIDHYIIKNNELNIINSNNKSISNTNIIEIKKNLNVEKKKNKKNKNKLNNTDEYFEGLGGIINTNLISCKCKKPAYLFIVSIPFKLVPNCLPNLYPVMKYTHNIFNDYYINIAKLKLNIYPKNNKKSIKKYRWYTDDKYYNEFIKTISFSTEEYTFKDKGKEVKKINLCHNPNRRLKIDNDIIDVEKLIDAIEEIPKQVDNNIIDKSKTNHENNIINKSKTNHENSDSKSSNEEIESSLNNKEEKNNSSKTKSQINNKDHNKRKSSILSFKSNNFHSSITSNESIESNKNKDNRSINNNTIKEIPITNEEKKIENDLTNKNSEQSSKNKVNNSTIKSLKSISSKDNKDNYFLNNNQLKKTYNNNSMGRYNIDNNKRNINIFKNNNKSNNNKKFCLSTNKNKNKIRLIKKNYDYYSNKEAEIIPYITEKNSKISSKPLTIKDKMKNWNSLNIDSRPHSGKYNFKHTYDFAFGKYEEKNKIKYKMNLIKEITTEFQKNLFFSKPKNKFQNKEFFPSIDFLINYRMKNKKRIEERKNEEINYKDKYDKYQSKTIQIMNYSRKKEIKRTSKKNNTLN